jgi:uncharacterized protein (DUF1778 family)
MSNVLIRDVPTKDLEQIRSAAAHRGISLQNYLLEAVHAQAVYLRRQEALRNMASRLQGSPEVADEQRTAVLDAIDEAHEDRAAQLGDRFSE